MKQEYPKWLYHVSGRAKIVTGPKEHDSHREGWYESPAHIVDPPRAAAISAPTAVPSDPPVPPAPEAVAPRPLDAYYAAKASDVCAKVAEQTEVRELEALRGLEENRPGGPRRTVLRSVADRLAALLSQASGA